MKKIFITMLLPVVAICTMAQSTARTFNLKNSADSQSVLTAFLPINSSGRAVVDCPGGGYSHLSMQNEGTDWAEYFNHLGIAYFVLKYRMPVGDRTIPMNDAENAIRTVRDSATSWKINPRDVGIMGSSAGGHLASTVCTHAEWAGRPNFSILFYPVISMDERITHKGSVVGFLGDGRSDKKLVEQYSNDKQVRSHLTPPAIILLANDDRAVPPVTNGVAYYSAMRRAGNNCAMYIYPSGGHGFGYRSTFAYHGQMLNDLTCWLNTLKAPRTDAVRVACIGNSITDGYGIDISDYRGYPAQLQGLLGDNYNVKNFGVGARTMLNRGDHPYMQELAWRDALAFNPNVVILKLGTNDSKPENWQYGADFGANMQQMVDSLKSLPTKPKIYLCTPIKAFKSAWGINDSIIVNAITPIIYKIAKRNKLNVIDLHTLFGNDDKLVISDGIHPNEMGAGKIAEIVAIEIKKSK